MTEVIYVDDKYSPEALMWYMQKGIVRPVLDKIYTIRDIVRPTAKPGQTGVLLNELVNKKVYITNPVIGTEGYSEVSFNINRFRNINGDILTKEMIEESLKKDIYA